MAETTAGGLWDGATDGFTVVPEDTYDAIIKKAEYKSSKSGKPQDVVTFSIQGGPHDGNTVRTWFTFSPDSPDALGILMRQLRNVLGEDIVAKLGQMPSGDTMMEKAAELLVGKACRIKVVIEPYQEEDRNKVSAVLPPSDAARASAADPFATTATETVAAPTEQAPAPAQSSGLPF